VIAFLALLVVSIWLMVLGAAADERGADPAGYVIGSVLVFVVAVLIATAITIVGPGDTRVLQLFGRYVGTVRSPGLKLTLPLVMGRKVSVKVRNFETHELKVNDADGNPVNIAAIIVWQVADTAKAVFAVEKYTEFVEVQSESALRHVASSHPYDNAAVGQETLRGSTDLVAAELATEVAARIAIAGLEVVEARISSLAYAPEIAHAMLQRQQASAVIAAREMIVEGAVSMVQGALRQLEAADVVTMDDERKAAMVSNLLVVLCSSSQATPVINTGSLYT
jgi:regulator of protease activity HflC (stomatin/prohibitin superfamily)